ncbi:hypothetical protein ACFP2T_37625 [Plantactinospora solaniradicis]|uniref:Uncharacterized protein n=1 Tax=Plantactinospora solaniradicis TaxID=1723736 RepID=A0ABW1KJS9_9ACTN
MRVDDLKPGAVLAIGRAASVQVGGTRGFVLRLPSVCHKPTYHGWVWLTGYVLDMTGEVCGRREIFVQLSGLRVLPPGLGQPGRPGGSHMDITEGISVQDLALEHRFYRAMQCLAELAWQRDMTVDALLTLTELLIPGPEPDSEPEPASDVQP